MDYAFAKTSVQITQPIIGETLLDLTKTLACLHGLRICCLLAHTGQRVKHDKVPQRPTEVYVQFAHRRCERVLVLVRLIKTQQNAVFQLSRIIHCAVEVRKLERENSKQKN
jgi:gamma-glutamyl:cysteine ligase YbdK (ATP-grasp superfamily)